MTRYRLLSIVSVAALALSLQVCGGGGNSNTDTGPTVPVPVPDPTPQPTPEPDAPLSASCAALGEGVPISEAVCTAGPEHFLDEVHLAIEQVRSRFPEYFNGRNVLNVGGYYVEIIRALDEMGLCAHTGGEELGVKKSDAYNDQFDILTAKNEYRTGETIYRGSCAPAIFPRGHRPYHPVPEGCSLPRSTHIACGDPQSQYYGQVEAAIDQMLEDHPELFDYSDINPGTDWPRLKDPQAYHSGIVEILTGKGFCAFFGGEEIAVKRTNELSENFDVNYKDEYVRRGYGIYRAACYPAAF